MKLLIKNIRAQPIEIILPDKENIIVDDVKNAIYLNRGDYTGIVPCSFNLRVENNNEN